MISLILCLLVSDIDFISRQVIDSGRKYSYQGSGGGGIAWTLTVYDNHSFYDIVIREGKDGSKSMSIDYYVTNIDFTVIKSPADLAAYELRYGRVRIFREYHLYDENIDGKVDSVQEFSAGPSGFTREERDEGKTRSGIKVDQKITEGKKGQVFFDEVLSGIRKAL